MTLFNFAKHCPATMPIKSQAGLIIYEYKCILPKDHHGPHRGTDGALWSNSEKMLNNVERFMK